MRLFKVNSNRSLSLVKETEISKEKVMQEITERNLQLVFGLDFVCTEFSVDSFRLDTLAFDPESKSFVIIEYKKTENRSVIDQGYAYLGKMLDRKADFVLQYNLVNQKNLQISDIDWAQSRVYFVSTAFNSYQLGSLIFNDLPISLWEIKFYSDNHMSYRRIDYGRSGTSIKKLSPIDTKLGKVTKEIVVYTEEDHLNKANEDIASLYETLRDEIVAKWKLSVEPKKLYIAFKRNTNIVDIEIQRSKIKITINMPKGQLIDNLGLAEDVSGKGKWGNGDYQIVVRDDTRISYILSLIEQSVKLHS